MLKFFYRSVLLFVFVSSATLLYHKNRYAYHLLTHIDPIPYTQKLIDSKKYKDAYSYLSYFMQFDYMKNNPKAKVLLKTIQATRHSLEYQSKKIAEGITTGRSDELSGQLAAIGSDFLVIGDIRDLAIEGSHYLRGKKVDPILVSLSTIGLVASASTLFTLGSSAIAKGGISLLKLAQKSNRMPPWLGKYLVREAKVIRQSKDISHLKPLFRSLDTMRKEAGVQEALKLLALTKDINELKGISKLSKRYGKDTSMLLALSDRKLLSEINRLEKMDKGTIKLASSYGSNGFAYLLKNGEKKFIKTVKRMKAYSKIGYKGEMWKVLLWLMGHLSNMVLVLLMGMSALLLMPMKQLIKKLS